MKLLQLSFILFSATIALSSSASNPYETEQTEPDPVSKYPSNMSSSRRGLWPSSRFLAAKATPPPSKMTCNKYPKICRKKGSPGRYCCKKKCVDVKTDRLNCGKCGRKCKYNKICCKGKCINPMTDRKNCGACKKKCKKGQRCFLGMCNYA